MAHNHESHFIPSPFKVVTQYENAFVKSWNESTAQAMVDILKYIAKATSDAIKSGIVGGINLVDGGDDSEVEKAHNVGDLHPNENSLII